MCSALLAFGVVSWVVSGSNLQRTQDIAVEEFGTGGGGIHNAEGMAIASTWMSYGIVAAIVGAVVVITWVIVALVTAVDEGEPSVQAES